MSCHNCGKNKPSRHNPQPFFGDIDKDIKSSGVEINMPIESPQAGKGFGAPGEAQNNAFSAFLEAKRMSYRELTERKLFQQRMLDNQQEQIMLEMSDAMRQIHIDELVAVVNHDKAGIPGMSSEQAIVILNETLARADFAFIHPLYPGLKEAVSKRFEEIEANRLPTPR